MFVSGLFIVSSLELNIFYLILVDGEWGNNVCIRNKIKVIKRIGIRIEKMNYLFCRFFVLII